MTYKHIVFDFGNVLAKFDPDYLLGQFCDDKEAFPLLSDILFEHWDELDAGTITPEIASQAISKTPTAYQNLVLRFFESWYRYLLPLEDTWKFIRELKEQGYGLYILSNAPVDFAEHAADCYEITSLFDGIVFSALSKYGENPSPEIYNHLFHTYHLSPADCFFLDDESRNTGCKDAGMDGLVFTEDIAHCKREDWLLIQPSLLYISNASTTSFALRVRPLRQVPSL